MTDQTWRSVTLQRTGPGRFVATNARGAAVAISGQDPDTFSPVELLLAAIAGCTGLDVDALTSRRAEPGSFELRAGGDKLRDQDGNRMDQLEVVFRVRFPDGAAGDEARAVLPAAVKRSHDRLCTVTRTVERATTVAYRIE
jgi:uncharacterized OsmC-like protein